MTDEKLICALKYCGGEEMLCRGCPADDECGVGENELVARIAADRLEALITEHTEMNIQIQKEICKRVEVEQENERLKAQNWEECCHDLHEYHCPSVPRWVSVEEQLPDRAGRYLCVKRIGNSGSVYVTIMNGDEHGFSMEHIYSDDVTYWMPLPEPPSTEESPTGQKG